MRDVGDTVRLRQHAIAETDAGIGGKFNACAHLAMYWAMMINTNRTIFWTLLRVVFDPALLAAIRAEVAPFVFVRAEDSGRSGGTLKMDVEGLFKSCPLLKATFLEIMRICTPGISYKIVKQDLVLTEIPEDATILGKSQPQSYSITKDTFLARPHGTMQKDPRLWEHPERFDPSRFLVADDDSEKVEQEAALDGRRPSRVYADYRYLNPWSGGTTMCKGRFSAEREVLAFVSALVSLWDLEPLTGE